MSVGVYRARSRLWLLGYKVAPHPVIVTIGDNRDHIRVLLYSYVTTITGWGRVQVSREEFGAAGASRRLKTYRQCQETVGFRV